VGLGEEQTLGLEDWGKDRLGDGGRTERTLGLGEGRAGLWDSMKDRRRRTWGLREAETGGLWEGALGTRGLGVRTEGGTLGLGDLGSRRAPD